MILSRHWRQRILCVIIGLSLICSAVLAGGQNFAKLWNSNTTKEKEAYVQGFLDGSQRILIGAFALLGPEGTPPDRYPKFKELDRFSHLRFDVDSIIPVITILYSDTANTCIELFDMIPIAEMKLNNEDITKELEIYRNRSRNRLTKEELEKLAPCTPDSTYYNDSRVSPGKLKNDLFKDGMDK